MFIEIVGTEMNVQEELTEEEARRFAIRFVIITPILLLWFTVNYSACIADYKFQHIEKAIFKYDDATMSHDLAKTRARCIGFSAILLVISLATGGYWALRNNGWEW